MNEPQILWVDDDVAQIALYVAALKDEGLSVMTVKTVTAAKQAILEKPTIRLAILDVMIPLASESEMAEFSEESAGGGRTGIALARWIRSQRPNLTVIGMTVRLDREVKDWFARYGAGCVTKLDMREVDAMVRFVKRTLGDAPKLIRTFIVHGHDDAIKWSLKNYLQNVLGLPEPIILHEQASKSQTLLEKFESVTESVDVVFVLLTPDDSVLASDREVRRARQNVILELGYFLGRFGRTHGKVILLYKGELELPSDINGLAYINIDGGVPAAGEEIRRELRSIVPV